MLILSSDSQMRKVIRDNRVVRPFALIFLELLTLVPSAVFTNTVAEFVPFSVGAVAVLLAFRYRVPPSVEISPRLSTLSYATYPSVRTMRHSLRSSQPTSIRPPSPPSPPPPVPARYHPYSASALNNSALQNDEWNPATARSTRTIDTVAAQSIHNAVVQIGQRARAVSRNEDRPQLAGMIVPSQVAYAEHLEYDYARANSLSTPLRPTISTPPVALNDDDESDLISPASRIPGSHFRLSRFGEGPSRPSESAAASRRTSFRTSYRTSFIPDTIPSSPDSDSVIRDHPIPLHDSRSISSHDRRRSASLSLTQESSVDHRRSVSIPAPARWPTFNGDQFRGAPYGRAPRSRASSGSSPPSIHRPPPLPLLASAGPGIRQAQTPRGPRPPPPSAQSPRFNLPS
jgi:hypothetical protein